MIVLGQTVTFAVQFGNNGFLWDPFAVNDVQITDPTGLLRATLPVTHVAVGEYRVVYTIPLTGPVGEWRHHWAYQATPAMPVHSFFYDIDVDFPPIFPALPAGVTDFVAEFAGYLSVALGLTLGVQVFYHQQPDADILSAPAILVRNVGGEAGLDHDAWREYQVQVLITGAVDDDAAAEALALQIDAHLHATTNWVLPNWRVDYCLKVQDPFRLGLDERGRPLYVQNFNFEVTPL